MKTSKAFFLFGYALFMAVFAGIFSLVWNHWPVPAPDIFYRPWQLSVILFVVFGISFFVSFSRREKTSGLSLNRFLAGVAVRALGILAVILPVAYLYLETKQQRVALVLCVLFFYLLSMTYYLGWSVWTSRKNEHPG